MNNQKEELPFHLMKDLSGSSIPSAQYTRIKHSTNIGDIIASMAAVKKYYDVTKRKVIFSQQQNMLAQYYAGAVHPTVNDQNQNVCVNQKMWEMIKPLIESQYYIQEFEKYEGQKIDLDFDVIRGKTFVNLPNGMIQSWIMYAFPDLACDLSKPWMFLDDIEHPIQEQTRGKVIINFTERYRNAQMDYFYLKNYADDIVFAGTEKEYWLFCNQWQLNIPHLKVNDFLELAYAIKAARFVLGCQSFVWNLSESLKTPRILELCSFAPNCMPFVGEHSYGYFHQVGNEYYFRKLYNLTK